MAEEEKPDGEGSEEVKKEAAPDAAKGAGSQKFVFIVLIVNVVVMLGLAAVVLTSKSANRNVEELVQQDNHADPNAPPAGDGHGGEAPKEPAAPVDLFIVENFTVNLAESSGAHYAQVDVSIEASDELTKEQINKLKPKIRDFIIYILSSKSYAQLDSSDARDFLREEIRNKINGYLNRGEVKNVFFTKFIVQ